MSGVDVRVAEKSNMTDSVERRVKKIDAFELLVERNISKRIIKYSNR